MSMKSKKKPLWGIKNVPCSSDDEHKTQRWIKATFLLQSMVTKALFPIQSTRSLDNSQRDLKAKQWGWDHWAKHAPPFWCTQTNIHMRGRTQIYTNFHTEKFTSVSLSCLTESWHHNTPFFPLYNQTSSKVGHFFSSFLLPLKEIHFLRVMSVYCLLERQMNGHIFVYAITWP